MTAKKSKIIWIGRRTLRYGKGPKSLIHVRIAQPERVSAGEWRCPFEIRGAGLSGISYARGVDALQALDLSYFIIRRQLDSLKLNLTWEGGPIQLAFPRRIPFIGTLKFTQKLERYVEKELLRHVAELKKKAGN